MFVVRYVALVALAIWVGGTGLLLLIAYPTLPLVSGLGVAGIRSGTFAEILHPFLALTYACAVCILACLSIVKLVGPPPRAFKLRIGLVALMLLVALYAGLPLPRSLVRIRSQSVLLAINLAIGLVLLGWYARD